MRPRRLAAWTTATLLFIAVSGVALAQTQTVADDFSSGGYSGSTGDGAWSGNWKEVNDSGGASGGAVRVTGDGACKSGDCLTVRRLLGLGLADVGAQRTVDLTDAKSATLSYHLAFPALLLGSVTAEAVADGQTSRLHSHNAGDSGTYEATLPVGSPVTVRFLVSNINLGATLGIDDVVVKIELPQPTTTTTEATTTTTTTILATTTSTTAPPRTTTTRPASGGGVTTTTERSLPSSTTTQARQQSTTTTRPRPSTTTPEDPSTTLAPTSTTAAQPASTTGPESSSPPTTAAASVPEPPYRGPVTTNLDPGADGWRAEAQDDLLVVFGLAVEDIVLDVLASAVLGLVLAWASLKQLD